MGIFASEMQTKFGSLPFLASEKNNSLCQMVVTFRRFWRFQKGQVVRWRRMDPQSLLLQLQERAKELLVLKKEAVSKEDYRTAGKYKKEIAEIEQEMGKLREQLQLDSNMGAQDTKQRNSTADSEGDFLMIGRNQVLGSKQELRLQENLKKIQDEASRNSETKQPSVNVAPSESEEREPISPPISETQKSQAPEQQENNPQPQREKAPRNLVSIAFETLLTDDSWEHREMFGKVPERPWTRLLFCNFWLNTDFPNMYEGLFRKMTVD